MIKLPAPVKGFTLTELLVVLTILAILLGILILIINPLELSRRSRDTARMSDLNTLQQGINLILHEQGGTTSDLFCTGLPYPCTGKSSSDNRKSDGTGWVKMNLRTDKSLNTEFLPIDPVNTAYYHYTYCSDHDNWEIATKLESKQLASKMTDDGGSNPDLYEIGTDLTLISSLNSGTCTYL